MERVKYQEKILENTLINIETNIDRILSYVSGVKITPMNLDFYIVKKDNLNSIKKAINEIEEQFNKNCCQANCCQTCQSCQRCQSCQSCQRCQSCQSCQRCQSQCSNCNCDCSSDCNCSSNCNCDCVSNCDCNCNCNCSSNCYAGRRSFSTFSLLSLSYEQVEPQYIPFEKEYDDVPEVSLYINGLEVEAEEVSTKGFVTPSVLVDYSYEIETEEIEKNVPIVWEAKEKK